MFLLFITLIIVKGNRLKCSLSLKNIGTLSLKYFHPPNPTLCQRSSGFLPTL